MDLGRLGPFTLLQPLGRGAMGRVYSARHTPTGEAVAVKILSAQPGPEALSDLRRELHAMAALHHPHILTVFDHGVALEDSELAPRGSPWLVMERASGGSLVMRPPSTWDGVQTVLIDLLGALAHAHAHGVIHRDLKLANVLICTEADRRPGLKLADFGVAWSLGAHGPRVAGTPHSMAPEQAAGALWALGPPTDLYALACLCWELVTGRPVFSDVPTKRQPLAHRDQRPPLFEPRMSVPVALEAWLRWLLAKSPADRPELAADALHALRSLGPAQGQPTPLPSAAGPRDSSTFTFSEPLLSTGTPANTSGWRGLGGDLPAPSGGATPRAPLATSWTRRELPLPLHLLQGAGASLFGLREVPFVGRQAERQRLWQAIGRAHSEGTPQLVSVEGARGLGGTRLARWMGRRAEELGAVQCFRAGAGGVVGMLIRELGVAGFSASSWEAALRDEPHAGALLAALRGDHPDAVGVTAALLARRARRRPVWLELSDAHRSPELQSLARRILDSPDAGPIVVVLGADPGGDEANSGLESLCARGERIGLRPLAESDMAALLRGALSLSPEVAGTLEVRAAGHPGFALELVRDWVADELLTEGPLGFEVPQEQLLAVPDSARLWRERLERVRGGWSPEAEEAGWVAAALGPTIHAGRLERAVRGLGEVWATEALDDLVRTGLATQQPDGWTLSHPMLREAWLDTRPRAVRHARLAQIAAWLATQPGEELAAGRLWLEADRPNRAHEPLLEAARRASTDRRYTVAQAALSRRDAALQALGEAPDSALRRQGETLRMRVLARSGQASAGMELARRFAAEADQATPEGAEILRLCGITAFAAGDWDVCEDWLLRSGSRAGQTLRLLGELAWNRSEREAAGRYAEQALAACLDEGDPVHAAASANSLGNLARADGDLDAAAAHFEHALELAGSSRDAAVVGLNLAWLDLDRGRPQQAHERLGALLEELEAAFDRFLLVGAAAMRVFSAARVGDTEAFDLAVTRCRQLWPLVVRHAHNTASVLAQAAEAWHHGGDQLRERVAAELAVGASEGLPADQRAELTALYTGILPST